MLINEKKKKKKIIASRVVLIVSLEGKKHISNMKTDADYINVVKSNWDKRQSAKTFPLLHNWANEPKSCYCQVLTNERAIL